MRNVCGRELHVEREALSEDSRNRKSVRLVATPLGGMQFIFFNFSFVLCCCFFKGIVTVHKYMMCVLVFY